MQERRFRTTIAAAALAGVVLRVVYVLGAVRGRITLGGDSQTYHWLADGLAAGRGYIRASDYVFHGEVIPTAEFPPAYPMLLALQDLLGIDAPVGQRIVGTLIGGVTIVVIGLLGAAVAGRVVGAVAAWLAALYPQLVVFDGSLLSEGFYALLIATTLLAIVRFRTDADRRWLIVASATIGLAVMTRSEAVLLIPFLVVPATRVVGDRRAWARLVLVGGAGTLLLVGVWTTRNAVSLGHFLPFTNNSGTLLAGANCDATYGGPQIGSWRFDCVTAVYPSGLDETDAAADLRSTGIDYALDHAGEVPGVMAVRVARTFGAWDIRTNLFLESLEGRDYDWLWAAWYAWLVVAALAVVGVVARRRAGAEVWPLLVPVAIVATMSMISYGNQRFRMMAEPGLVVLAAVGAMALVTHVRRRASGEGQTQAPVGSS